jgi:hypothetical protein
MKKYFLCMLIFYIIFTEQSHAQTETYVYNNVFGETSYQDMMSITKIDNGYFIEMAQLNERSKGGKSSYFLDIDFNTIRWDFENEIEDTKVSITRIDNSLSAIGKMKGKTFKKIFKIDSYPWYQEWQTGCTESIRKGIKEFYFYSFDPKISNITKFKALYISDEELNIETVKYNTLHYSICIDGFLRFLMKGNFWYNIEDYKFIKSEVKFILASKMFTRVIFSITKK